LAKLHLNPAKSTPVFQTNVKKDEVRGRDLTTNDQGTEHKQYENAGKTKKQSNHRFFR